MVLEDRLQTGGARARRALNAAAIVVVCGVLCCVTSFSAVPVNAEPVQVEQGQRFVRLSRDEKGEPLALETALVRLTPSEQTSVEFPRQGYVDLVSAVHVGEKAYYEGLNRRFADYDAVLFELIAPPEFKIPKPQEHAGNDQHPVSLLQRGLQSVLKLEFQLDKINYRAPNFVHADMSPDELSASMARRNESFSGMMMRAMAVAASRESQGQGKPPDISSLFLLMFDDARAIALRRIMAREFEDIDVLLDTLNGPEGSSIITERNKVALSQLERMLSQGKSRLAIFYGGAHMPDFERQLIRRYQLVTGSPEWLLAWNLGASPGGTVPSDRKAER